ncbi:MAG: DHH family phosphoesterase [archaeon]|nr:MAG: DHH family phosphoesterase [archaeon]
MKKIEKKTKEFLLSLDRCSLVYHGDADGVCSAVLMAKFLGERVKMVSPNDSYGIQITEQLMEEINNYPYGIFVDLAADQWDVGRIKSRVLVIDHHTPKQDLNKMEKFIHVNPRLKDPEKYLPASYLVYEIISKLKEIGEYVWIANVGIIGDRGKKLFKCKENGEDLKFLSDVIEASKGVYGYRGIVNAYRVFLEAQRPQDVLDSKLIKVYQKFQKAIDETMIDFKYHSEYFPDTNSYLYKVYNKYKIASVVSTKLSEEKPDAAFFVYTRDKVLSMSARCQTARINLAELFSRISEGIGSGGGHPAAAAANIPKENADKFMERLRNYLEGI